MQFDTSTRVSCREVADHCSEQLHQHFAHRLAEMDGSGAGGTVARRTTPHTPDHSISHPVLATLGLQEAVGSLLKPRSPLHPDHHASRAHQHVAVPGGSHTSAAAAVPTGASASSSIHPPPAAAAATSNTSLELELPHSSYVQAVEDALHYAFRTTDEELMGTETGEDVGATAVVAVLGKEHIWIAHCGECKRRTARRLYQALPACLSFVKSLCGIWFCYHHLHYLQKVCAGRGDQYSISTCAHQNTVGIAFYTGLT